jgi:general secretion pathway protein A
MGQTELKDRLAAEELRQLRQRILVHYELRPFTREEMDRYIHHRLTVSGSMGRPHFTPWALRHIFNASRGIPRIINNLCDNALLAGFAAGETVISRAVIEEVAETFDMLPRASSAMQPSVEREAPANAFTATGRAELWAAGTTASENDKENVRSIPIEST